MELPCNVLKNVLRILITKASPRFCATSAHGNRGFHSGNAAATNTEC